MTQATILSAAQTAATSTDVELAAGEKIKVGLFTDNALGIFPRKYEYWLVEDTPGADNRVVDLAKVTSQVVVGPGTYRVVRPDISANGVNVGVFTEDGA